jgi:hypothetical protein
MTVYGQRRPDAHAPSRPGEMNSMKFHYSTLVSDENVLARNASEHGVGGTGRP